MNVDAQPWCVVELYRVIEVDEVEYANAQLIVGPFPDQEEAEAYAGWVRSRSGPNLIAISAGEMTKIPVGWKDDSVGAD